MDVERVYFFYSVYFFYCLYFLNRIVSIFL